MKRTALFCLFTLFQAIAFAQFKTVAETPLFKEPESGFAKLLQLKNGNTVVVHLTNRNGINLTFYDPQHKLAANKHHSPKYEKLKGARVNAIFETEGTIVVMVSEIEERTPILYRLVFDGTTGNLEREEKIAEADKFHFMDVRWIPEFDPVNSFAVSKDPSGDNYAVFVRRDKNEYADKNQMEVIVYNGRHQETGRAFYQPPFKYASLNYLDMAVVGEANVYILGFAYNQIAASDREGQLVLLTLANGARKLKADLLELPDNRIADSGVVRYNPVTKKLLLLGTTHIEDVDPQPYGGFLAIIDPLKAQTEQFLDIYPTEADVQKKKLYGDKNGYTGIPQDLIVQKDGGFTIIYEELITDKHVPLNAQAYTDYLLENLAVSSYDASAKLLYTSFIPKKQLLKNTSYTPFYTAHRRLSAQQLILGEQYRSFSYLHTNNKTFIFLNDAMQNEAPKNNTIAQMRTLNSGQAYALETGTPLPARKQFFGPLKKNETNTLSVFNIADYNSEQNIFVTLKLEINGKSRNTRIVWLTPEK
ncbi:hypothetical protein [Chitinophaga rhizophila]|uniref:S9 family peptidase n=1 Tax=Chitinophaga rhizophila TaxID=2866212 RepID=A0ABS7G7J7_9BACT|nr:hypothetical protein [Chitinophaga rhizophila]MBW8683618.1 hypothetical protein [Chitinophaga rhizophila]